MTEETPIQAVETPAPDAIAVPPVDPQAAPSTAVEPKKDNVQSRFDELTRHRREAERERDYYRELALRNSPPKPIETPTYEAPKTLADFEYDDSKYASYVREEARKEAREAARQEFRQEREREHSQQRQTSFATKESEFSKTVDDYDAVTRDPRLRITNEMAEAIASSDDGPALAYHLGKNTEVAAKIAQLPPIVAARELGRIEAQLAYERDKAKDKPVSKAPPPPPKVEGVDPAVTIRADSPDSDKLSTDDWLKKRNKQLERRK